MREILFAVQDTLGAIGARLQTSADMLPKVWNVVLAFIIGSVVIALIVAGFLIGCAVQDDIAPPAVTSQPASREAARSGFD